MQGRMGAADPKGSWTCVPVMPFKIKTVTTYLNQNEIEHKTVPSLLPSPTPCFSKPSICSLWELKVVLGYPSLHGVGQEPPQLPTSSAPPPPRLHPPSTPPPPHPPSSRAQGEDQDGGPLCPGKTGRTGLQIDVFRRFYEPNSCVSSYLEKHYNLSTMTDVDD